VRQALKALVYLPLLAAGCGGDSGDAAGAPPPAGFPSLAGESSVPADYLGGDCPAGELQVTGLEGSVDLTQDGVSVKWTQTTESSDLSVVLQGLLCESANGFELHMRSSRVGRSRWAEGDRVCEVRARFPAGTTGAKPETCDEANTVVFAIDPELKTISGTVAIGFEYRRDCASAGTCVLRASWDATAVD
jgi:hypothetical protein